MKRLILLVLLMATVACEQRSPTQPDDNTREVPVQTIEAGQHAIHYNTAVYLPNGGIAFVCGHNPGVFEMTDGTRVKVSHMLSSTPCSAAGVGTPYQP